MAITTFDKFGKLFIFKKNNYTTRDEHVFKNRFIITNIKSTEDLTGESNVICQANKLYNETKKGMIY
jgi:hypothetical protein